MFTVIDREIYSTLELLLTQLFGDKFEVQFATYRIPGTGDQDFSNSTQFYFSVVVKDLICGFKEE